MSIRAWSNDYVSGYAEIDAQHRTLFKKINTFAVENDASISSSALLSFIDDLGQYCVNHFGLEEKMMGEEQYPLHLFHADQHTDLKRTVGDMRQRIIDKDLEEPYGALLAFTSDWLNTHIASDDLTFISFCRNKDTVLGGFSVGEECEIHTMDDERLARGYIKSIQKSAVEIVYPAETALPLTTNEMVKIMAKAVGANKPSFIAKVFASEPGSIQLMNAVYVYNINNRKYPRIQTDMPGRIMSGTTSSTINIRDISAGGLLMHSESVYEPGDTLMIEFIVQNNLFMELCSVVRREAAEGLYAYGMKFVFQKSFQSEKLASYIFNRQSLGAV